MAELSHAMENVVGQLRAGTLDVSTTITEPLLRGLDKLESLLEAGEDTGGTIDDEQSALVLAVELASAQALVSAEPAEPEVRKLPAKTAELPAITAELPAITAEIPTVTVADPPAVSTTASRPGTSVRISLSLLDKLMNLAAELVLVRNQNSQAVENQDRDQIVTIAQRLNVVTSGLQNTIMQTRMRPVGHVLSQFRRVVRDLAAELGKEVSVEIEGAEVELDKNIIEAIHDPLTHLVRNAVDHGIEPPEDREAKGKQRQGRIRLGAFHRAGQVHIEVTDDGRGMDAEALRRAAFERGLITAEQASTLSDREAYKFVFEPGFSMAAKITDVSGRGVGMDVVLSAFKSLGGVVDVTSAVDRGTTISIKLPLTLAIVPTLIVSVEGLCYAIPQINIDEVVWLHGVHVYQDLQLVDDREVYWLREMYRILCGVAAYYGSYYPSEDFRSLAGG